MSGEAVVLRMIEYDFHIALESAIASESGYEIRFPESAVLYLRHTENTPDEIRMKIIFPGNINVDYSVPVIKAQQYSGEDIIGKQLYFLIPYYILRYEHISEKKASEEIAEEYRNLYHGLIDARDAGLLDAYDLSNIIDFTNRMADYILSANQKVKYPDANIWGMT